MITANFSTYNNYVTDSLYQWDINQLLSVSGLNLAVAPEVHFSNADMDKAIVRQSVLNKGVVSVLIPNSLLQSPLTIVANIGVYEDNTFKVLETVSIPVKEKAKPTDYKLENSDEEVYSFEALKTAIANMVTLSKFNSDTASIIARIDNIIAHNNKTDGNSELIDVRTDIDGTVHKSAGESVRTQITKRLNYKVNGWVYPPRGSQVNIVGNDDGSVSVTVFADSLTYILPGGTEYGGVSISSAEVLTQLPANSELTDEGYLVFTIPNYNALCFNTSECVLKVKSIRTLSGDDIVLIYNTWANVAGGSFMPSYYKHVLEERDAFLDKQKTFLYIGSDGNVDIEADGATGVVQIILEKSLNVVLTDGDDSTTSANIPVATIISQLGASKAVASGDGVIITLSTYRALCYNLGTKTLTIKHIRNIKADDIVLLTNTWANVQGVLLTKVLEKDVKEFNGKIENLIVFNSGDVNDSVAVSEKCTEYTGLFNGSNKVESFLFFTDPHLLQKGDNYETFLKKYIVSLEKYYKSTPTSFILCGGDWLGNSDTITEAKYKLGYIDGFMNGIFDNYYSVLGNHDTNYQGVDAEGNNNAGLLDNQTITNLWYRKYGANYYAFDGDNTRFYVLDSGTDWDTALTEYRLSQIDWLAEKLKSEDRDHSAIAIHIYFADTDGNKTLITAYNKKQSVVINGATYDFTRCTGRVEFILTGHTHRDMTDLIDNKTPVICTSNTRNGNTPSFDLIYVDYDNRKINTVRIGTGNNRVFNI